MFTLWSRSLHIYSQNNFRTMERLVLTLHHIIINTTFLKKKRLQNLIENFKGRFKFTKTLPCKQLNFKFYSFIRSAFVLYSKCNRNIRQKQYIRTRRFYSTGDMTNLYPFIQGSLE